MALVEALISTLCLTASPGDPATACNKALEAGSKQSGVAQTVGTAEDNINKRAIATAYSTLGVTTVNVVGGGIFLVKTAADKAVTFNPPNFGLCDKITQSIGVGNVNLKLEWNF